MRLKTGLDWQSFMSQTNDKGQSSSPNMVTGALGNKNSIDALRGFNQKSHSVSGELSMNFKRPGTASNLEFNKGLFSNIDE